MNAVDWTALGSCATALMAGATFFLALKTRSMAKETNSVARATAEEAATVERQTVLVERQVVVSTRALQATVQPWLIWESGFEVEPDGGAPFGFVCGLTYSPGWHPCIHASEENGEIVGWLRLRNVGNGLALLEMSQSYLYPKNERRRLERIHPSVEVPVVPTNGTVDITFRVPAAESVDRPAMAMLQFAGGGAGHELFAIEVVYGDAIAGNTTSARFSAHRTQGEDEWSVFAAEYRQGDGEPVVVRRYGQP